MTNTHTKEALDKLLAMFEHDQGPKFIARTYIERQAGDVKPSNRWSICNYLLMLMSGADDARGYRQWQDVKRQVKAGARAFHILGPSVRKIKEKKVDQSGAVIGEEDREVLLGFHPIPVFRVEDTDGEPLPAFDYKPAQMPPLIGIADRLGLSVKWSPGNGAEYGSTDGKEHITLKSTDRNVYFHELAHCVHAKLKGSIKAGQHADQETVAELTAAVIAELYGYEHQGDPWAYIKHYHDGDPTKALRGIGHVLNEVVVCVDYIVREAEQSRGG